MIDDAELASLRATQFEHLPELADVYRHGPRTPDGRGGILAGARTAHLEGRPARVAKPTAAELTLTAERFGRAATWVVTMTAADDVAAGDELELELEAGPLTLEVIGVVSAPASWVTALRLACVEAG